MCDKCNALKNVPVDKKATVKLFDDTELAIDAEAFRGFMQLNHTDEGTPYAFIKQELIVKSTGRSYGKSIYITHCPFCGERLC